MQQNETFAYNALDMALGRGGDQAIVKNAEKYPVDKAKGNAKKYTEL